MNKVDAKFNLYCLKCKTIRGNDNGTWVCDDCLKERQKTHPKVEHKPILCEKCGEKTITKLVGDEVYDYCLTCDWTTH